MTWPPALAKLFAIAYDREESPGCVLFQPVASLIFYPGGDVSLVEPTVFQRIGWGKGSCPSVCIIIDAVWLNFSEFDHIKKLEGVRADSSGIHVFREGGSNMSSGGNL